MVLSASAAHALLLPPEGIRLRQIYVQFEWPAVNGASDYELQVVEDNGQLQRAGHRASDRPVAHELRDVQRNTRLLQAIEERGPSLDSGSRRGGIQMVRKRHTPEPVPASTAEQIIAKLQEAEVRD